MDGWVMVHKQQGVVTRLRHVLRRVSKTRNIGMGLPLRLGRKYEKNARQVVGECAGEVEGYCSNDSENWACTRDEE